MLVSKSTWAAAQSRAGKDNVFSIEGEKNSMETGYIQTDHLEEGIIIGNRVSLIPWHSMLG